MKNIKIVWPTIVAIALSCTLVSCYNDYLIEEGKETNNYSLEENYNPDDYLPDIGLDPVITVEDYMNQFDHQAIDIKTYVKTR